MMSFFSALEPNLFRPRTREARTRPPPLPAQPGLQNAPCLLAQGAVCAACVACLGGLRPTAAGEGGVCFREQTPLLPETPHHSGASRLSCSTRPRASAAGEPACADADRVTGAPTRGTRRSWWLFQTATRHHAKVQDGMCEPRPHDQSFASSASRGKWGARAPAPAPAAPSMRHGAGH